MANRELKELCFSQYKRFVGEEVMEIRPVTVLVGKNSSGKSSITKLLPVLAKSMSGSLKKSTMQLDTDGVSLGISYQSLCHNGNNVGLKFSLAYSDDVTIAVELIATQKNEIQIQRYFVLSGGKEHSLVLAKDHLNYEHVANKELYMASGFSGFIHKPFLRDLGIDDGFMFNVDYIGPLRSEPSRTHYYNGVELSDKVGPKGDNAYQLLCADDVLVQNVSEWFRKHFNGCRLQVVPAGEKGSYLIQMNKPDNGNYWVNIVDEGMGMSQVLPIVVRCLHGVEQSVVVIEQPELHLHPAAHEHISHLLAATCKRYSQRYVVETHSANVLLGLREAVVDQDIDFSSDDIIIYFVDEDEEGVYLKPITISAEGMLSDWPEGVFNESSEILNRIVAKSSQ